MSTTAKTAQVLRDLAQWAPVVEALRGVFGSPRSALAAIRRWELEQRKARDKRMGR